MTLTVKSVATLLPSQKTTQQSSNANVPNKEDGNETSDLKKITTHCKDFSELQYWKNRVKKLPEQASLLLTKKVKLYPVWLQILLAIRVYMKKKIVM